MSEMKTKVPMIDKSDAKHFIITCLALGFTLFMYDRFLAPKIPTAIGGEEEVPA